MFGLGIAGAVLFAALGVLLTFAFALGVWLLVQGLRAVVRALLWPLRRHRTAPPGVSADRLLVSSRSRHRGRK
jgi:hypothetical protein